MENHIETIEAKAKDAHAQMLSLTADESMAKLIKIVHGPGWTTLAEATFLTGILDATQAHTKVLAGLQQAALLGASKVELNPQPLPPSPPTQDFNPQPDPPGKHGPTEDLNPQPLPPGKHGPTEDLNPQPLPPGKQRQ